jgi:hypothetical protein
MPREVEEYISFIFNGSVTKRAVHVSYAKSSSQIRFWREDIVAKPPKKHLNSLMNFQPPKLFLA